jgi:formate hydrogenlyase subunit 3/multisubunit Na+/H+ antiporter MnhD subunit
VQRGLFWPLILAASLLEAVAAASLAMAVFSDPVPRRVFDYSGSQSEIFGRATSLDWSSDGGLLISAIICFALGIAAYVVAARWR